MNNKTNENQSETKIEEMDSDFLKELNQLSKQLKTDDEIINDYKVSHPPKYEEKSKNAEKSKNEKETKNDSKPNLDNNNNINIINNNINEINIFLNNNNINENPFKEAYNLMNSKENNIFNLDENNLMFESLDSLNSKVKEFNSILFKTFQPNGSTDNGVLDEKENNVLGKILDFLIQSDLLKGTISNMKKSIEESLEKNKNNLKKEENEKYQEALLNANNILNEMNNINPDKNKIMDSLQKLQQISNDVDSILFI